MKTAQGKTITITNGGLPTENGPCSNGEVEDLTESSVHEVAAKVVENVVRLASEATQRNSQPISTAISDSQPTQQPSSAEIRDSSLMRLPTFQIDTVPSMPPSPDWSSTNEENPCPEEPLDEEQIEIQFGTLSEEATEEIRSFATSYVEDLITKAMTIAEEKLGAEEKCQATNVAMQVVEDVITKATEKANERLQRSPIVTISLETLEFPSVPSIQIDTVASMPPSPTDVDDEDAEEAPGEQQEPKLIKKDKNDEEGKTRKPLKINFQDKTPDEVKTTPVLVKFSQVPEEMKEFAASYVKDIISKAISMAEEKFVPTVPFSFDDGNMMKSSGPWYVRAREALLRLLRTACFCTPRRNDS